MDDSVGRLSRHMLRDRESFDDPTASITSHHWNQRLVDAAENKIVKLATTLWHLRTLLDGQGRGKRKEGDQIAER